MMHDWYTGWGGMGLGSIAMILPLLLLVALVVIVVRWLASGNADRAGTAARSPREILDERFARGEIDDEEYQSRRKQLEG